MLTVEVNQAERDASAKIVAKAGRLGLDNFERDQLEQLLTKMDRVLSLKWWNRPVQHPFIWFINSLLMGSRSLTGHHGYDTRLDPICGEPDATI